MKYWCDPPSGWKYGFPRVVDAKIMEDVELLTEWLIECGYPEEDIELALEYSRYWKYK